MATQREYNPQTLADESFAKEFSSMYDVYVTLRMDGVPSDLAVIKAFRLIPLGVSTNNAAELGIACDVNPYVERKLKERLAACDVRRDLWPQYRAVHALLKFVEDPRERGSTRLNAIVQLNAMCGYVQLDGATVRKVQQTIADFERQHREWMENGTNGTGAGGGTDQPRPQTH